MFFHIFLTLCLQLMFNTSVSSAITTLACDCMEYWECITNYCGLYATRICCYFNPGAQPIGILPGPRRKKECGKKTVDNRKEEVAEMHEYPWHAAILEKDNDAYVCGASLIDERWLLTTAHCVQEFFPDQHDKLKLRLGEYDVNSSTEPFPHQEIGVKRLIVHHQFNNETLENDIALIKLQKKAEHRPNIGAVCIPHDLEMGREAKCYVTGWGKFNETSGNPSVLKEIVVPLWSNDECGKALGNFFGFDFQLPATAICAGSDHRDSCEGDGGGPLVCEKNGKWYQIGIVSFGIGCGSNKTPGVYTRVASYVKWIKQMTNHF